MFLPSFLPCVQPPLRNCCGVSEPFEVLNEICDDCCGKFVADFAEMASAHDTVSDVSDIGAEFDDPGTPLTGQRSAWLT